MVAQAMKLVSGFGLSLSRARIRMNGRKRLTPSADTAPMQSPSQPAHGTLAWTRDALNAWPAGVSDIPRSRSLGTINRVLA